MLAQEMSIYWANFAKTGAPASDTTAPWPAWSATGDTKYLIQPPESSPGLEVKLTALAWGLGISLRPKR
jgi:carboxylesterase type B